MTFSVSAPTNNTGALLNNGTEVLSIDNSNNIGIGTDAPARKLHVKSDAILAARIESTNADFSRLTFKNAGTTTDPYIGSFNNELRLNSTGSSIVFQDGATEKMRIDSNGYITKPNQPAFAVGASSAANPSSTTAGNNIIWDVVYLNRNNVVNTTNGRFTAPVSGSYFISFHSLAGANGANVQNDVQFRINGTRYMDSREQGHSTYWESISMNVVVNLNANDYVETYVNIGEIYSNNQNWAKFSGFLIG